MTKPVFAFSSGDATMRDLLGGKGANLAEMTRIGLPVPPGFTITTEVCGRYGERGGLPDDVMPAVRDAVAALEADLGKRFGGPGEPLLLSVRSGARVSMPGMMDTILNLGLNDATLAALVEASGDERFAQDARRRFVMMFSDVVLGVPKARFEAIFTDHKARVDARTDADVSASVLREVNADFLDLVLRETGAPFPDDPWVQLQRAIEAVFDSWGNPRAAVYRKRQGIPDHLGTAVNVQVMVFGNLGDDCGTGVAFTRDPSSGERRLYGEYLTNAQGEDVVAGVRTPRPIDELEQQFPAIYAEFLAHADQLEQHFHDMMDLEFTVERGRLFMLQCRTGLRTGPAAVRMAVEMVAEGLIDRTTAVRRVSPDHLDQLLHPRIDPAAKGHHAAVATGIGASPGAAVGRVVFGSDRAIELAKEGRPVILVREETNPDDVGAMLASKGVLTARGGKTSHAAVVARGFGVPCVAGCGELRVGHDGDGAMLAGQPLAEGDWVTIDGTDGAVYRDRLPLIDPEVDGDFQVLMGWCDEIRRLGVRANADNERDARAALEFGAEGIGLCRTEHMFFEADRLPIVREMILAEDEHAREVALAKLEGVQQSDFERIFEVMDGRPVTIRLIDPPLHEFMPDHDELLRRVTELRIAANMTGGLALKAVLQEQERIFAAVDGMREQNPMLGLRGVRLSIVFPGIVHMQTRAILQAAVKVVGRGVAVRPEIMVPLVGHVNELRAVRAELEGLARSIVQASRATIPYTIGTMIEIPRAALTAGEIAEHAEFFSFGTNDLTQTCFGFSRDDAEARFLGIYTDRRILEANPFERLDVVGVGRLMRIAVTEGRATRADLKCGICGEHGGDPSSIDYCEELGLDYVSCSPYRVPIARLAAAQAVLRRQT